MKKTLHQAVAQLGNGSKNIGRRCPRLATGKQRDGHESGDGFRCVMSVHDAPNQA